MASLQLAAIIVEDYDAAITFFVEALDFELVEDSPAQTNDGRPKRWAPQACRSGIFTSISSVATDNSSARLRPSSTQQPKN